MTRQRARGKRVGAALFGVWLFFTPRCTAAADIDWNAVEREASNLLGELIRIDTTNPPGNETAAAQFLAAQFKAAGIAAQVFESAPQRGSVQAVWKGDGRARPIVLLSHLDVVPANPTEWQLPPFEGVQKDGYVHGRGALDCKGIGTINALALILLQRQNVKLARDIIFLATADEETGGKLGTGWLVEHQLDAMGNPEFVLNEGSHIHSEPNGSRLYQIAVAEKTPCWLRLTASGKPGHGSSPPRDTAVTKLVHALERLHDMPAAVRVTPEVQAYFQALAPAQTGAERAQFKDLRKALADDNFRKRFLLDASHAALVQNTITPTVLSAGQKTNVIPRSAEAEVDCRLLPDSDPRAFVAEVVQRIADPTIRVEVILNFPPSASSVDSKLYRAIAAQAQAAGSSVVPSVLTGFTDSHYFREKGIISYGFTPFVLSDPDTQGEHGINERISTANLRDGTRRLYELLLALGND